MEQTDILLESGTNELEIVEFFIDEGDDEQYRGYYGVNVAKVLEIIRRPKVTELPQVPHSSVLGAFKQRSGVIPLVDLSHWLGKEKITDKDSKVIVTEFNKITNGFLVSGVNRIHRVSWEDVEPPGEYVSSFSDHSVIGVVRIEDRIVFLVDLEKIVGEIHPGSTLRLDDNMTGHTTQGYKALIADDSSLLRKMLGTMLHKAGFNITEMNHGGEAWEYIQEIKKQAKKNKKNITDYLNIVISDIEMPTMDGMHLTKNIKEDPELKVLPVILFSSLISEKLRHKGEAVGADDQISKPEVGELARRATDLIEKYLGENHRENK
ncbi:MAG: chemotaxis protein [Thermodesulfobacteriota bacterium]